MWMCVYVRVSVCPCRPASVVFHWGKSTLSISCHVWLPSVGTDNTAGSAAANSPINERLANRKMVTRHATLTLANEKYFGGRNLAKECARRHRSVQNPLSRTTENVRQFYLNQGKHSQSWFIWVFIPSFHQCEINVHSASQTNNVSYIKTD